MSVQLLRAADRTPRAWLNGGGATTELACEPTGADFDAFGWRVSIAEVAVAGPFSCFTGVDRSLSVLDGTLALSLDGAAPVLLTSTDGAFAFAGDAPCHGAPVGGPVRDLNVMVRRGQWRASVTRVSSSGAIAVDVMATTVLIVSTHVSTTIVVGSEHHAIGSFDALRLDDAHCGAPLSASATEDGSGGSLHVIALTRAGDS